MSTTGKGSGHQYERLPSPTSAIRLLTLHQNDETHSLDCSMRCYELDSCPAYIALSYEWGDVDPQVEIMINGLCILIRHNLWLFLSVLKAKIKLGELPGYTCLWIDAICIDQADLSERNAQVSIMGKIYQKAVSVFAWIGWPHAWDPGPAFEFIQRATWALHVRNGLREASMHKWMFRGLTYDGLLQMILQMCRCRYWSRRWIVQEILLAGEVTIICGEYNLSWNAFSSFVGALAFTRMPTPRELSLIHDLEKTIPFVMSRYKSDAASGEQQVRTLCQLLVKFCGMECEVPHDKVYSLLSLATDGNMIPVDYGCSLQNLLYKVTTQNGWSHNELQLLAKDLGVFEILPNKFLHAIQSKDSDDSMLSWIKEKLVATHQLRFCSLPLKFGELGGRDWKKPLEVGLIEPCQDMIQIDNHSEFDSNYREFSTLMGALSAGWSRFLICNDGSTGLVCKGAKAGDVLCDFIPGRKLVIREDHENSLHLVGTAILQHVFPISMYLLAQVKKNLELARQEEQYNDFLQLDCSMDGSTVVDAIVELDKGAISDRIQALRSILSSLEAGLNSLGSGEISRSFPRLTLEGVFNIWDLIALAKQQPGLISLDEEESHDRPESEDTYSPC